MRPRASSQGCFGEPSAIPASPSFNNPTLSAKAPYSTSGRVSQSRGDHADRPEFYHLLTNSCTINIVRYANAAGRVGRLDIRHILNGLADSYLYRSGRIDTTLPFDDYGGTL